jgi:8-oxo-dGTP pyrophosphatase MutT (NUDIX family)
MYKVFINDKKIFLSENIINSPIAESDLTYNYTDKHSLESVIEHFTNDKKAEKLFITTKNVEILFKDFRSLFHFIDAAGGLVENHHHEILFIFRLHKWDLPKGKVEADESIEQAALREVEEECGISGLNITEKLPSTFHIYTQDGIRILKETHWFRMQCSKCDHPVPQTIEDISAVRWIKKDELDEVFKNTYASIAELLQTVSSL